MGVKTEGLKYALAFSVFSVLDALTTWAGVRRGFAEGNPVIASRISNPTLFFGSFALFTILGIALILLSIKLAERVPAAGYFPPFFVLLKALPVVNNAFLLTGTSPLQLALTTTGLLFSIP
ncbi:hypothetical protein A3L09_04055 [Thermococcus profundus]|uniref:DUF5658 domain-containing protein n=1 Tax=Thermococcus profundus TaxID=49899 RepID=A0A2Z2MD05_THEPR|nr:DUF5658 family protein [Thermococcus profundus]ASJ02485.1 hypothetical protein A3L09_04055 [Thermococcus profundus]